MAPAFGPAFCFGQTGLLMTSIPETGLRARQDYLEGKTVRAVRTIAAHFHAAGSSCAKSAAPRRASP